MSGHSLPQGRGNGARGQPACSVEQELGSDLSAHQFELHAGRAYVAFGLAAGLTAHGADVLEPLEGLRQGERLSFYKRAGCL